jgi:hypothetical protein
MKDFSPPMTPTFGILFYVKKTKVLTNGPASIYPQNQAVNHTPRKMACK